MFLQASLLRVHVYMCWLGTNHILPVYLRILNQIGKFLSAITYDLLLKQDSSCVGLQRFLKSEEVPVHSSEWLMSLQSAVIFTAVLFSCVTDLHAMAVLIKLELSRFSRDSFHFPTHYVTCCCQCSLTGTFCKSCQSILLPSWLITTSNLYLNGIFHSKMDTNRKADTQSSNPVPHCSTAHERKYTIQG